MNTPEIDPEFEALLEYIKHNRGFDFTGYKRPSLMRRVQVRMQNTDIQTYGEYTDYLEVHPEEFSYLFNTILINVTAFFRDRAVWEYLEKDVVPKIVARKNLSTDRIRVWCAGCASGQEAYTLAMVLAEVLGLEEFHQKVKIYATNVDEIALHQARQATYNAKEVEGIPPPLLERYFNHSNGSYTFCPDLRRSVIFGRHDLLQDPPISRIDLLSCRNTLMYFHAETQAKIISRFHFALNEGSFLVLGKAELLLTSNISFVPLNLKQRIFIKAGLARSREYFMVSNYDKDQDPNFIANNSLLRDAVFDIGNYAQIVVDVNGLLILANEQARLLFKLSSKDINRPLQDLEVSYRPVELRSPIDEVINTHRAAALSSIGWAIAHNNVNYFDVQITPLYDLLQNLLGVSVVFVEVSRYKKLQEEIENANQELEMAYEQLQSTNEELETTNEELQSANEELETTNEELQSTNEELETMNEELQSSNEELQTINAELRLRSEELNQANGFLEAIFNSLTGGVAVLNRESIIQIWNEKSEDLWGLRSQEVVGQHFMNLDIGLPVEQLRQPIRDCLSGDIKTVELSLSTVNRRGKTFQAKVTCSSLVGKLDKIRGVIVLVEAINTPE
ncbi:CheR family methyltransferase [Chlorogloea sp. CCALA 695]|uniref:CheR family methyltransferase n=1 Tax=Chlorogloea sp. CCALA 695 TaxID=2107693 RepID=UPI000D04FD86|nr:CheR family methyltransferase [Chlorogloea sp. CCALA 695]PSB33210.1 chemotaxis protein CheR [Chlorogloea sp. CCALA 695]